MLCKDQDLVIPNAGIGHDHPTLPVTCHPENIEQTETLRGEVFIFLCLPWNDWKKWWRESKDKQKSLMSSTYGVWSWMIYERSTADWTCTGWGVNSLIHGRRNIQDCTYMGTGLWNDTNSVNLHWKTVSFNLRLFMGKRFYQLVWINTVVQYNNNTIIQNKSCEKFQWALMSRDREPRVSYSFWFSISVINKKCLHALLFIRWTSFWCSN